jgi:hypothetical protein
VYEFLTYARRGKTSWWRWLATPVLAVLLVTLITVIAQPLIVRAAFLPPGFNALIENPSQPLWYYGHSIVFCAVLLLSLVTAALVVQDKQFIDVLGAWRWSGAGRGAAAALAMGVIGTGVDYLVDPKGFQFIAGPQTATLFLVAVPQSLIGGLFDELFFSGFVTQGLLLATKRPFVTAGVVGVLGMYGATSAAHAAGDFIFTAALALITIRTGGIAFAWGFTSLSALFGAGVAVESDDVLRGSPGLFAQTTPELAWLDVAVTAAMLVGVWFWIARLYPADKDPTVDAFA